MSKNYMEHVAQMLGVEMGEKFEIEDFKDCKFYISKDGLKCNSDEASANYVLSDLITGKHEICKIPKRKHTGLEDVKAGDTVFELSGAAFTSPFMGLLAPSEFMDRDIRDNWRRYITIKKRLAKAASELNSEPIDWNNCSQTKWSIYYNHDKSNLSLFCWHNCTVDDVYFTSRDAAHKAIEIVGKDDLIWMLRDFQPYLGYSTEVAENE